MPRKTVFKQEHKENFTTIGNYILNDKRISWKAKGLLCYLLSKPETWKVYIKDLSNQGQEGRVAISNALKELRNAGYMNKKRDRDNEGHFKGYIYEVYENPRMNPNAENLNQEGVPKSGFPKSGNLRLVNTEYKKRDNNIKKENKKRKKEIDEISSHYQQKIKSNSRLTKKARKKIKTRLKEFKVEELKTAIDNFSEDDWWMDNNSHRGMSWFFHSEDRIDQFINLEPRNNKKDVINL